MLLSGFGMSKAFLQYWIILYLINGKKVSIPKALCVSHCWLLYIFAYSKTPLNQNLCNLKPYCKLDVFSSSALYTCCTYRTSPIRKPLKPEPLYLVPRVFSLCATWQLGINVCSIFIVMNYIHISVLIITRYITV